MRALLLPLLSLAPAMLACGSSSTSEPSTAQGGSNTAGGAAGAHAAGGTSSAGTNSNSGGTSSLAGNGNASGNAGAGAVGGQSPGGAAGESNAGSGGVVGTPGEGIAAAHPGDQGIIDDPAVLFADDFESYAQGADLNQSWDAVYQNQYVAITTEPANVFAGAQALEFTLPQQEAELSDAVDKVLTQEQDELYLRYYSKFQPPYDVVGSSHNGSSISAHYFNDGMATPGIPADGTNKFLVNLENWRGDVETPSPGLLNVYVYHPDQRSEYGDHFFPTGVVMPNTSILMDFGPNFVAHDDIINELDRWYCYEYRVKANTVGQRDGRITIWLDGEQVADFGNLRFRDVDALKIDRFGLSFHIGSNPNGETKKWYDNVVAATSYIGPMAPP
jgi:hypothetical protein